MTPARILRMTFKFSSNGCACIWGTVPGVAIGVFCAGRVSVGGSRSFGPGPLRVTDQVWLVQNTGGTKPVTGRSERAHWLLAHGRRAVGLRGEAAAYPNGHSVGYGPCNGFLNVLKWLARTPWLSRLSWKDSRIICSSVSEGTRLRPFNRALRNGVTRP